MVGPPYLIGPESALYKLGRGTVQSQFDSVKLDVGHTFCLDCDFQLRAFGGVEVARIGQTLTGTAESRDLPASSSYTNHSRFTGAGPRIGVKGQYALGSFDFAGEVAGAALIGTTRSRVDYLTVNPNLAQPTVQYLQSPDATRVIPAIDARVSTAYNFAPTAYGRFKLEVGYQAAVYFDAVGEYAVTQVPTSLVLPPTRRLSRHRAASAEQLHHPRPVHDREVAVPVKRRSAPRRTDRVVTRSVRCVGVSGRRGRF